MLIDVSIHDPAWLKVKAALEEKREVLLSEIIGQAASDRDRSDKAAQVRLINTILKGPAVAADRAGRGG